MKRNITRKSIGFLVVAASQGLVPLCLVVAPGVAQAGQASFRYPQIVVVAFGQNGRQLGAYRRTGTAWEELDTSGNVTFRLVEQARDEWSLYLLDPSRNVRIQIDLFRKKILYAAAGAQPSDLYDVFAAADNGGYPVALNRDQPPAAVAPAGPRPTGGPRWILGPNGTYTLEGSPSPTGNPPVDRYARPVDGYPRNPVGVDYSASGPVYQVAVGPIWNNTDAQNKCGQVARDVRGIWTGDWVTIVQNRTSVCDIRFPR